MMRKTLLCLVALASPLAAQDAPLLFDSTRTVPLTPGQWIYAASASGSEARYGASFSIRCDRLARRVTLRRPDAAPTALTIGTDLSVRAVAADGVVAGNDSLLDAIAFSRGRFIVISGGARLVLPASPEAARSIEDCRN